MSFEPDGDLSLSHLDSKVTVEVENLGREFESKQGKVVALDSVSLNVREGEIFGVLGAERRGQDDSDSDTDADSKRVTGQPSPVLPQP